MYDCATCDGSGSLSEGPDRLLERLFGLYNVNREGFAASTFRIHFFFFLLVEALNSKDTSALV